MIMMQVDRGFFIFTSGTLILIHALLVIEYSIDILDNFSECIEQIASFLEIFQRAVDEMAQ